MHAAKDFIKDLDSKKISQIVATLFGSLALTGKGHLTDQTIDLVLKDFNHKVIFDYSFKNL